jgi:hypothetical protein
LGRRLLRIEDAVVGRNGGVVGIPVIAPAAIEVWSAHRREVWSSDTVYECYRQRAIGHSRRPQINRDRLLTRFLDAVSGW